MWVCPRARRRGMRLTGDEGGEVRLQLELEL